MSDEHNSTGTKERHSWEGERGDAESRLEPLFCFDCISLLGQDPLWSPSSRALLGSSRWCAASFRLVLRARPAQLLCSLHLRTPLSPLFASDSSICRCIRFISSHLRFRLLALLSFFSRPTLYIPSGRASRFVRRCLLSTCAGCVPWYPLVGSPLPRIPLSQSFVHFERTFIIIPSTVRVVAACTPSALQQVVARGERHLRRD